MKLISYCLINFLKSSTLFCPFFKGLEESSTAAQHNCQQDFSFRSNFSHIFFGALKNVFISAIC